MMKDHEHSVQLILFQQAQELHLIYDNYASAISLYEQQAKICRQQGFHPELIASLLGRGACLMHLGRNQEALAVANEAREVAVATSRPDVLGMIDEFIGNID